MTQSWRKYLTLAFIAAAGVFLVALPHTGLLGFGRPLFVDEAVNIDSGISFLKQGWVTYRGVPQAFSPLVSSGVLGSILPGLMTEVSQTYVAGRAASALQDALALGCVGLLLAAASGWPVLSLLFVGLAMLIPALPASLVYTQAEPLSFLAISAGFYLYASQRKPAFAGLAFCLAVHLKLLAVVDITGGVFALTAYEFIRKPTSGNLLKVYLSTAAALLAGAVLWQLWQIALTPTWAEYLAGWNSFLAFFQGGGSGLQAGATPKPSRWLLLSTSASEFGAYSLFAKGLILGFCLFPIVGAARALSAKASSKQLAASEMMAAFSGAALFHLGWWFLKSDQIWIRHGFLGLFSATAVAALLASEVPRLRKALSALICLIFLGTIAFKSWRGVEEFRGKPTSCLTQDQHFNMFCDPAGAPLKYSPWLR